MIIVMDIGKYIILFLVIIIIIFLLKDNSDDSDYRYMDFNDTQYRNSTKFLI